MLEKRKEPFELPSKSSNIRCKTKSNINQQRNYSTDCAESQQTPVSEIKEKFEPKKKQSILLSESYNRIGYENKAFRVSECGTFLEFSKPIYRASGGAPVGAPVGHQGTQSGNGFKLHNANFCRDRLCPMCSWRRSYKIFAQVSQIMSVIGDKYDYLFLTLTVPNCSADELSYTITEINKAWHRLVNYKRFIGSTRGYFKVLEVTRNKDTGTYHPHLHIVVAVTKRYFKNKALYIDHDEWLKLWQKATRDETITQVDIRKAKSKNNADSEKAKNAISSAVAEIAKYAVKSADYIISDNKKLTDEIVNTLVPALSNRRLCSFGGIFDEIRKQLNLDDTEDGDLIHLDNEINSDLAVLIYRYGWSCGAYKLLEIQTPLFTVNTESGEIT